MKQLIFVKDEDGLYDKDPKKHTDAKLIPKITLDELLTRAAARARSSTAAVPRLAAREATSSASSIVNGLVPGQLTRALRGEDVGTVITKERRHALSAAPSTSALGDSPLTGSVFEAVDYQPVAMMPDVKVVKIGGQSIMDRGRAAVFPILDEIVAARKLGIQVVLLRRRRHARAPHLLDRQRARDADRRARDARQVHARCRTRACCRCCSPSTAASTSLPDDFEKLPLYLQMGCIPIDDRHAAVRLLGEARGRRPHPAAPHRRRRVPVGRVPRLAGARSSSRTRTASTPTIRRRTRTRRTSRASAPKELIARDLPDVVLERVVIEYLPRARWCKELQIVNGLEPGQVSAALAGEDVGTIIYHPDPAAPA